MVSRIVVLGLCFLVVGPAGAQVEYLDNGVVRVGADLSRGGAIAHLGQSGSSRSVVNIRDLGRYVQQSYYSGPDPYLPDGTRQHPAYAGWGWNPVQAGSVYWDTSTTLESWIRNDTLYVRSVPRQWALDDVDTACTMEQWITLQANRVHVRNRLVNARPDTTRYAARHQELPAVYTVGELHRLFTYTGDSPFTGDTLTQIVHSGPPWEYWTSTEQWSALVDDDDWGLGVFHPGALLTVGGFAGTPGYGGPLQNATGYVSPLHTELLDHDIVYEYDYTLTLGDLQEIRDYVYRHAPPRGPQHVFTRDRQHCVPRNLSDDAPPYDGVWTLRLDEADPQVILPPAHWKADVVPVMEIRAAYRTIDDRARVFFGGPGQGFSADRVVDVPVVTDGVVRSYLVDLSRHPLYSGTIERLRFDPVATVAEGDEVDLHAIRMPATTDTPPAASGGSLSIESVHPNPFNPRTTVWWRTEEPARVEVDVLDTKGRHVARLVSGRTVAAGRHAVTWDGRDDAGREVASGTYLVRVRADDVVRTRKIALVR